MCTIVYVCTVQYLFLCLFVYSPEDFTHALHVVIFSLVKSLSQQLHVPVERLCIYIYTTGMSYPFPQAMEAELTSRKLVIESVCATGQDLNSSGHFASSKIRELKKSLQEVWSSLLVSASQRSQLLQDSLAMQRYYTRATEAESLMNDRRPLVGLDEYGKDEDDTQVGAINMRMIRL